MTEFKFYVTDIKAAKAAIRKIDKKFKSNEQVQKVLWREIRQVDNDLFVCEFLFPFPNLVIPAWLLVALTIIISFFWFKWWLFVPNAILIWIAYTIKYMQSEKYYFLMLRKGMFKNGYRGEIWRI